MATYQYSNIAARTTTAAYISATDATLQLTDPAGLPITYPFTLIVDVDAPAMEIVTVTGLLGGQYQIDRGQDGTPAQEHQAGAVVAHEIVARDLKGPQDHMAATSNVHGVTGNVVGTSDVQVLTNKTIDGGQNTITNIGDASLDGIAAAKIVGQLTDGQLAGMAASKLTGQVTDAQIQGLATAKLTGQVANAQIVGMDAAKITGQLVDAQIQNLAANKLTGTTTTPVTTTGTVQAATVTATGVVSGATVTGSTVNGTADVQVGGASVGRGTIWGETVTTTLAAGTSGATEATAYTKALTLAAGRAYKVSAVVPVGSGIISGTNHIVVRLKSNGAQIGADTVEYNVTGLSFNGVVAAFVKGTGASVTFTVTAKSMGGGAFDVSASTGQPFLFEVTDIGPSTVAHP